MPNLVVRGGYGIGYVHQNRVGSGDLLGINGPQVVIATVNQSNPLDPRFPHHAAGLCAADSLLRPTSIRSPPTCSTCRATSRRLTSRAGSSACSASCARYRARRGLRRQPLGRHADHGRLQPGLPATHADRDPLAAVAPPEPGLRPDHLVRSGRLLQLQLAAGQTRAPLHQGPAVPEFLHLGQGDR